MRQTPFSPFLLTYYFLGSAGNSAGIVFFLHQFLKPKYRTSLIFLFFFIPGAAFAAFYLVIPPVVRDIATIALTVVITVFSYHGTLKNRILTAILLQLVMEVSGFFILLALLMNDMTDAELYQNYALNLFSNCILINAVLIPLSLLLKSILGRFDAIKEFVSRSLLMFTTLALLCCHLLLTNYIFQNITAHHMVTVVISSFCLVFMLSSFLILLWMIRGISSAEKTERESIRLRQERMLSEERLQQIRAYSKELGALRDHLSTILSQALRDVESGRTESAIRNIERQLSETQRVRRPKLIENHIADYFTEKLRQQCVCNQIEFQSAVSLPDKIEIEDMDFCTILANIVDNAVKASLVCTQGRFIRLEIHNNLNILFVGCSNSTRVQNDGRKEKRRFGSFGLQNIREVIDKYGGDLQIRRESETFTIQAILYLRR
ncbi:MAG: GHKL domain-containing protein [Ethanoligenens sp.]|uniref:GHKL domain-containing protein n=1 Tax=Ethanoligenens sp. TaxID=2099655 RepID=UPI0039EC7637